MTLAALARAGERGLVEIITATHLNNTTEQFHDIVERWITSTRHPRFQRLHTQLIYQPMLELLLHLRGHAFKTFIVTRRAAWSSSACSAKGCTASRPSR